MSEAEARIDAIKAYHRARVRLGELALEFASAPASDLVPGVTPVYVKAMAECLRVLQRYAHVAEGQ